MWKESYQGLENVLFVPGFDRGCAEQKPCHLHVQEASRSSCSTAPFALGLQTIMPPLTWWDERLPVCQGLLRSGSHLVLTVLAQTLGH